VTKELTQIEQTIEKTREQFVDAAKRATKELDLQRMRLKTEIDRANARATRTRTELQKGAERELKKQFRGLEKALEGARKDAARFRDDLEPVMDNLVSARNHLAHALRIDKALASVQRELKRRPAEERVKAKVAVKKTPARKKAVRKAPARRKAVLKTPATKKPVVKQPPTEKAA